MRMRKLLAAIGFAAALLAGRAEAQSTCPYIQYGAVLTAAQWNQCFANKQDVLGYTPVNKAGDTMLGSLITTASTASLAGFNLPPGTAPASPANGDMWTTAAGLFVRINGATVGPLSGATSSGFAATAPLSVSFPSGVVTYALNINSSLDLDGSNNLQINPGNANVFTTLQSVDLGTGSAPAADVATGLQVLGANSTAPGIEVTAWAGDAEHILRQALGTRASPSALTNGTEIGAYGWRGYDGSAWSSNNAAKITGVAEATWSNTSHPTEICLFTTPVGATTMTSWLCQHDDGGLTVGAPTGGDEGAGTLNLAGALYNNGTAPTGTGAYVRTSSPTISSLAWSGNITGNVTISGNNNYTGTALFSGGVPTLANGNAYVGAGSNVGALFGGQGSVDDFSLVNKNQQGVCANPTGTTTLSCVTLTLTNPLTIANGGTGAATQSAAASAIFPTPTRTGDVVFWNGVAWQTLVGNSSGTQVLQETSAGVPSWATVAGTGTVTSVTCNGTAITTSGTCGNPWVLLNTLTASNSATLSDTTSLTSTYLFYRLVFTDIIPATTQVPGEILIHSGGSFRSTGYISDSWYSLSGGIAQFTPTTYIPASIGTTGSGAPLNSAPGISGYIDIFNPSASALCMFRGQVTYNEGASAIVTVNVGGYWNTAAAVDGIQFSFSSGNITSGTIKIYGRN